MLALTAFHVMWSFGGMRGLSKAGYFATFATHTCICAQSKAMIINAFPDTHNWGVGMHDRKSFMHTEIVKYWII